MPKTRLIREKFKLIKRTFEFDRYSSDYQFLTYDDYELGIVEQIGTDELCFTPVGDFFFYLHTFGLDYERWNETLDETIKANWDNFTFYLTILDPIEFCKEDESSWTNVKQSVVRPIQNRPTGLWVKEEK